MRVVALSTTFASAAWADETAVIVRDGSAARGNETTVDVRGSSAPTPPPKDPSLAGSVVRGERLRAPGLRVAELLRTQPGRRRRRRRFIWQAFG
ncbi:MAG: hypothetical protein MUF34_29845 [Polyangiaceae bacterium]|nr:hypothetical protein [Polyangiaceae bacterium]